MRVRQEGKEKKEKKPQHRSNVTPVPDRGNQGDSSTEKKEKRGGRKGEGPQSRISLLDSPSSPRAVHKLADERGPKGGRKTTEGRRKRGRVCCPDFSTFFSIHVDLQKKEHRGEKKEGRRKNRQAQVHFIATRPARLPLHQEKGEKKKKKVPRGEGRRESRRAQPLAAAVQRTKKKEAWEGGEAGALSQGVGRARKEILFAGGRRKAPEGKKERTFLFPSFQPVKFTRREKEKIREEKKRKGRR